MPLTHMMLPNPTALPAPVAMPPTGAEKAALEAEGDARNLRTVWNELNRYKEEPLFAESAPLILFATGMYVQLNVCLSMH